MMEASAPRYKWGQQVQAAADLYNDGSYPEHPYDALLVQCASRAKLCKSASTRTLEQWFIWLSSRSIKS